MPNCKGRFHLYLDMSKFAMGSTLYQIQNGKPKLIPYASKRLPEAARNVFNNRIRVVWFSNQYSQFFSHL